MTTKPKKTPDVAATGPPDDWIHMEIAIPPACWELFVRVSIRVGCKPVDIVDHILKLGYEGHQLHEQAKHVHAKSTQH